MAESYSTGFRDALNATGSVKSIMANGILAFFGGTKATSADKAEGSNPIALVTLNGDDFVTGGTNGINMGESSGGVLSKATDETWIMTATSEAGSDGTTATWWRWYDSNYITGASEEAVRMDGLIGTTDSYEVKMSNRNIVEGATGTIASFKVTCPAS